MASRPAELPTSIKFGDFELNVRSYQLRSAGIPLKLKPIPMKLLMLLIEHRGELVTRDQIVERIWGTGVHLDSDNGINSAISKLRQVLRDDAENPRFIETVTGRGYRFVAHVVESEPVAVKPAAAILSAKSDQVIPHQPQPRITSPVRARWPASLAALLAVFIIGVCVHWARSHSPFQAASQRVMLAVLPFQNLTGDAGQEYFSDGLTEEILTYLGRLDPQHLGVIARTSVMHYKHSPVSLNQIGRQLGVQYVLEGSVRRDGSNVRIDALFIRVKDQSHLWSHQYDRELHGMLALQAEIAQEIADEIELTLGSQKPQAAVHQAVPSPSAYQAYDLYLRGLYFWNLRTIEGFRQAINYFEQAAEKDPNYAQAYAGVAGSYALMGGYSGVPEPAFMAKARAAAQRALNLDDTLPEAHTALGLIVQNYDHDWQAAEKEFRRAIELNSNYSTAHHWYAEHLILRGRFDEGFAEIERARQLDPLSLIIVADKGAFLYYSRQYDRSIEQLRGVLEMDPNFSRAHMITLPYIQKGMFPEALAVNARQPEYSPYYWSVWGEIEARSGHVQEALRAVKHLTDLDRRQQVDAGCFVVLYLGMGREDQAFAWLEKSYAQHSNIMSILKVDPRFDPLRSDPRFQELLRRVGLAP